MTEVQFLIFDSSGSSLVEVEPKIESVAWRLNRAGRVKFSMGYADPKCTRSNLRPGNRVLLRFDNGLPNWGGVLDFPRKRGAGGVACTAYGAEHLLSWRVTAKSRYFDGALPGYIFSTLITEESADWPTGIVSGDIASGGTERYLEYHYHDLLERIEDLQRLTGHDFYIAPNYSGGTLGFRANWYTRRGSDKSGSVYLVEGHNVEGVPSLDEQGPVQNRIILVGEGQTWGDERATASDQDTASRDLYGYREYSEVQSGVSNTATLENNAAALLEERAYPRERLTLTALDREPATFADYDVGDRVTVEAFLSWPEWAYSGTVRVIGREWRPSGACRLEVETW